MTTTELSRIDRTIEIAAPPQRVWKALTTPEELSAWFQVTIDGEIAPGNQVWFTLTIPEYRGVRFEVRFVEMIPPVRFVWQWHPGAVDPAIDYSKESWTTVIFTLEPTPTGTRVSVSETGFDAISLERRAKVYADNSQGWTTVVGWLQKYVEAAR